MPARISLYAVGSPIIREGYKGQGRARTVNASTEVRSGGNDIKDEYVVAGSEIQFQVLEPFDASGKPVAVLEAVYLR